MLSFLLSVIMMAALFANTIASSDVEKAALEKLELMNPIQGDLAPLDRISASQSTASMALKGKSSFRAIKKGELIIST